MIREQQDSRLRQSCRDSEHTRFSPIKYDC